MSRMYEMTAIVSDYNPKRKEEVIEAAMNEWDFNDFFDTGETEMEGTGQSNLCGGESEEEFADRLAIAIWTANEGPCTVKVNATYIEELPYEEHIRGPNEYPALMKKGKK